MTPVHSRAMAVALIGGMLATAACGVAVRGVDRAVRAAAQSRVFHRGRTGALTAREREWALSAWRYFDVNVQPGTGLVGGVEKASSITMWQTADYVAAIVSARQLGFLDGVQFDERFRRVLQFLNQIELYNGRLPNRVYSTQTGKPLTAANKEGQQGWSAIDLGRLLMWMRIARDRFPSYAEYIDKAVARWTFCDVVDRQGTLNGGVLIDGKTRVFQEGRLGYEQYAAAGFSLWGFGVDQALALGRVQHAQVLDIDLLVDARDPRVTGVPAPVVTAPYVLLGLELDWRLPNRSDEGPTPLASLADSIYRVQAQRYAREHLFTARTDHPLSRPPYFVYDSIFAGGYPFDTTADDGSQRPDGALVSTRAAFGLWALWNTDYTTRLMATIEPLHRKDRGWLEGRFEQTGGAEDLVTSSTNALVLESLFYKREGTLFQAKPRPGYFDHLLSDEFGRPARCLPAAGPASERRR